MTTNDRGRADKKVHLFLLFHVCGWENLTFSLIRDAAEQLCFVYLQMCSSLNDKDDVTVILASVNVLRHGESRHKLHDSLDPVFGLNERGVETWRLPMDTQTGKRPATNI